MAEYPRAELEEMVELWLEANRQSEKDGNWVGATGWVHEKVMRKTKITIPKLANFCSFIFNYFYLLLSGRKYSL